LGVQALLQHAAAVSMALAFVGGVAIPGDRFFPAIQGAALGVLATYALHLKRGAG
jgi:hypothetical protein